MAQWLVGFATTFSQKIWVNFWVLQVFIILFDFLSFSLIGVSYLMLLTEVKFIELIVFFQS